MTCSQARHDAAAALLTGQALNKEAQEHIDGCPECQRELRQLQETVDLLALAPPTGDAVVQDDLLLRRLLTRASEERRRRRRTAIASVAAATVLVAAPLLGWWAFTNDSESSGEAPQAFPSASASQDGIEGQVSIQPVASGSRLLLSVSGVAPGTRCSFVAVTADGGHELVDTWKADYSRSTVTVGMHSFVAPEDFASLELRNSQTSELLLRLEPESV